jgi:cysteine desulfurase/selenocysteine lyase
VTFGISKTPCTFSSTVGVEVTEGKVFEMPILSEDAVKKAIFERVYFMREHFPIFKHNPTWVYLDSASTAQKLDVVIEREREFYERENANVHRGLYALSSEATQNYERVRQQVALFIRAKSANEIAFTKGATESINIVANSFAKQLKPGDNVVVTVMEHHANFIPWQQACLQIGAEFRVAPITTSGELDLKALATLLDSKTKILALTHLSNVLGTINPVQEIVTWAHQKNIPVLIDASQSAGHLPLNVVELDADFLVFSAHKMYGPMGVGVLYAKAAHHHLIQPLNFGGGIVKNVTNAKTEFLEFPRNVEAGTPNVAGVISFGAAIEFLGKTDLTAWFRHSQKLAVEFRNGLSRMKFLDVSVIGNPESTGPIVSFVVDGMHPHDLASLLAQHHVAVRAGHHCAQPLHDSIGVPATVRASFSIYNAEADVKKALLALHECVARKHAERVNELYHDVILQHSANPYHYEKTEGFDNKIMSNSPVCGDKFEIHLQIEANKINSVHFHGIGCSVSKASTSVLAKQLEGLTLEEAKKLVGFFLMLVDKNKNMLGNAPDELAAFFAVRQYPERYECAALPWLETQKFLMNLSGKTAS